MKEQIKFNPEKFDNWIIESVKEKAAKMGLSGNDYIQCNENLKGLYVDEIRYMTGFSKEAVIFGLTTEHTPLPTKKGNYPN